MLSSSRPIRVAMLMASVSRKAGGIFWSSKSLVKHLIHSGVDVKVFGASDEKTEYDIHEWEGVPIDHRPVKGPRAFGYTPGLLEELRRFDPDIIHVHGLWMYPSVAATLHPKKKAKFVISPHGMLDPWAIKNSRTKKAIASALFEKRHLLNADCVIALGDSERVSIRRYGLTSPIAVIPNGVDLFEHDDQSHQGTPEWRKMLPSEARTLLFMGRLHHKKGLEPLLEAWARIVKDDFPKSRNWHLVIAGWDQNNYREKLEHIVEKNDHLKRIHFVGPLMGEDKIASLNHSDAFILPSFSEGLPMSVLEAWSHGLPVLMTAECNLPEGFLENAALKIAAEPNDIARGIHELIQGNLNEIISMGENGRKLAETQFSWLKVSKDMLSVYEWLVHNGPQPNTVDVK